MMQAAGTDVAHVSLECWLKRPLRAILAFTLYASAITVASAQNTPTPSRAGDPVAKVLVYDVVSIRQPKGDPNAGGLRYTPDGFTMINLSLRSLIPDAYGAIRDDQVTGWPGWAAFARFDIEAKMDPETADAFQRLPHQQHDAQRQLMMQSLLVDRFKLKVRRGTETRTTYELVLAKGGSRLKEDAPKSDQAAGLPPEGVHPVVDWRIADGSITGHAMPISTLAFHLQGAVDGIVAGKTGLNGFYDIALKWDPRDERDPASTGPSVFSALEEQLGLHLKPTRTIVETIVIDHLEMPSED